LAHEWRRNGNGQFDDHAAVDMGARQEDNARLDHTLPAGATLYAWLRAGVRKSKKPERELIDMQSARHARAFADYIPQRSAAV
jgi:hypothetical protein